MTLSSSANARARGYGRGGHMSDHADFVAWLSLVSSRRVVRLETPDLGAFARALDGTGARTEDRYGFPTCRDVVVTRADVPAGEVWAVYADESRELVARLPSADPESP